MVFAFVIAWSVGFIVRKDPLPANAGEEHRVGVVRGRARERLDRVNQWRIAVQLSGGNRAASPGGRLGRRDVPRQRNRYHRHCEPDSGHVRSLPTTRFRPLPSHRSDPGPARSISPRQRPGRFRRGWGCARPVQGDRSGRS